jgi:subtilase family serine protease
MPRSTADTLSPPGPPAPRGANAFLAVIAAALLSLTAPLGAQPLRALPARVSAPSNSHLLGPVPDSQTMRLAISLPLRNPDQLNALLQQLYDPASPNFRKFLTVRQFTERFGPTSEDYARVLDFAKSRGLTVTRTFSTRLLVNVSGPSSSVNATFHVTMQRYQHPTETRAFYAPDVEPTLEADLPILTVDGLSDFNLPRRPLARRSSITNSTVAMQDIVTGSGPGGEFLGSDISAAYAPGVTLDGSGQTLGLVELGPYDLSDVQLYFSTIGQTLNVPIYPVYLDGDGACPGTPDTRGCNDGEEVIDMQQILSMAPNASALIVYTSGDALTAYTQAATDNLAKQISLSFGFGGTPSSQPGYEQIFMELAAQGQGSFVVSGDGGALVGDSGYPGNSPNITVVGGTDLVTAGEGGPWSSESGWVGSGGGWNTGSPIPSYQTPVINASNQGSTSYRNIPDVAMEANTDSYICANGQCGGGIGGTSLSSPRWAGFMALVNQQANGTSLGFLNPTLYRLGQGSTCNSIFHDITTGDDFNSSSPNMFTAVPGYDLVTGWGSPNGQAMIDALAPANTWGAE